MQNIVLAAFFVVDDELHRDQRAVDDAGAADPLDTPLAVSPLAWPLAYRWPVQRLSPEFQPAVPPDAPTFIVVYRDAADAVQFLEIGAETARLLDVLERSPGLTGRQALSAGAGAAAAEGAARAAIGDLLGRGVLVPQPVNTGGSR